MMSDFDSLANTENIWMWLLFSVSLKAYLKKEAIKLLLIF